MLRCTSTKLLQKVSHIFFFAILLRRNKAQYYNKIVLNFYGCRSMVPQICKSVYCAQYFNRVLQKYGAQIYISQIKRALKYFRQSEVSQAKFCRSIEIIPYNYIVAQYIKGTNWPDKIRARVVPIERPKQGHTSLQIFDFSIMIIDFFKEFKILGCVLPKSVCSYYYIPQTLIRQYICENYRWFDCEKKSFRVRVTQRFCRFFHWIAKVSTKLAQIPPRPPKLLVFKQFYHEELHNFKLHLKNQETNLQQEMSQVCPMVLLFSRSYLFTEYPLLNMYQLVTTVKRAYFDTFFS